MTIYNEEVENSAKDWDTDDSSQIPQKRKRVLSEMQKKFVVFYCTSARGDASQAAREAGYGKTTSEQATAKLLTNLNILEAIKEHREGMAEISQFSEEQIMKKLWGEANYYDEGATHAGRINALVWLGKHMGMFDPNTKRLAEAKSAKGGNTYNIINYSNATNTLENQYIKEAEVQKVIELKERDVLEAIATDSTALAGVNITSY